MILRPLLAMYARCVSLRLGSSAYCWRRSALTRSLFAACQARFSARTCSRNMGSSANRCLRLSRLVDMAASHDSVAHAQPRVADGFFLDEGVVGNARIVREAAMTTSSAAGQ